MITIANIITKLAGKVFGPFLWRRPLNLLALALLLSAAPSAHAQTYYIGSDSGDWATAGNWNPTGIPGSGATVDIGTFSTTQGFVTVTLDYNYTSANALGSLTLNDANSFSTDLVQNNSSYNMDATTEIIGTNLSGNTYDQSAGTNTVGGTLTLGQGTDGGGAYNLSGTGTLTAALAVIGASGTGTFTQIGTSSNTLSGGLILGDNSSGTGIYNLSGTSTLSVSAGGETIGSLGTGTFTQSGNSTNTILAGSVPGAGILYVGLYNSGAYNLGDTATLTAVDEYVGDVGSGTFNQNGTSSNTISGNLSVGKATQGTYNLSGAGNILQNAYLTAGSETIGDAGNGTFNQSGTAVNTITGVMGTLIVGSQSTSTGTYTLSDTASLSAANETIGDAGTGTFTQSGTSSNAVSGTLTLGNQKGSLGTYTLSGMGTLSASNETIGDYGQGTFTQSGTSSNTISGLLQLGLYLGSTGSNTYQLSGAGTLTADNEDIGVTTGGVTDTFTQSGTSSNTISGLLRVGVIKPSIAAYNLGESGTLTADNEDIGAGGNGTFTQSGTASNTITYLLDVGAQSTSTGAYNLKGGSLTAVVEAIGDAGNGTFTQSGSSTNTISESLVIGDQLGSTGTYNLSGTATLTAADEFLGELGYQNEVPFASTAIFTQTGGVNTVNGGDPAYFATNGGAFLTLFGSSVSLVQYNLKGGILNGATETVGDDNTTAQKADFNQTGGTNNALSLTIGEYDGLSDAQGHGNGTYELNSNDAVGNATTILTANSETIGNLGTGTFTQSGSSSNSISGTLDIGSQSGSTGTYTLSDTATLSAGSETVGDQGTGTFTQSGTASNTITGGLILGNTSTGIGTYNLEGGTLSAGYETIGGLGTGTLTQSGTSSNAISGFLNVDSQS